MTLSETIAIGELSRRTRCNIETIRYYERIGLLPKAARRGRYRSFGLVDVERLHFVRRARELGFTIDEIRALLGIAAADDISCENARTIAASHLNQVRARIADLRRMERVLADTVRACSSGEHMGCPLISTLSAIR
ncbi:helix-turn-helix domain-containing protein [Sphingomonas canadensis]|uniref:Helix-turn-helix domain-containing protein n=1 Tax=Sphingomonas canadensis TaxID=1219257 RepID=A0ABW3H7M5_9SPHN|nr:helix-turn-helix domain-containing protein [Sphingomonas canadensis]MCW3837259.1 helix-turn-helix domain-containing protein [Sphingomonas canadensis]